MVKNDVFSMVGGLGGDFCKETHEAKLCGIHIGSASRMRSARIARSARTNMCFEWFGHNKCEYGPQSVEFTCFLGRKWVSLGGQK